tara:strand:+ start:7290 stop:7607 length:318 start_codon:yes stop_codon:yes gene_type:complete
MMLSSNKANQKGIANMSSRSDKATAAAPQKAPRTKKKLGSDAIKALEIEYFKKRRELERAERAAMRTNRAKHIAEGKKFVTVLRKRYAMTDEQIVKRLGLKPNLR